MHILHDVHAMLSATRGAMQAFQDEQEEVSLSNECMWGILCTWSVRMGVPVDTVSAGRLP